MNSRCARWAVRVLVLAAGVLLLTGVGGIFAADDETKSASSNPQELFGDTDASEAGTESPGTNVERVLNTASKIEEERTEGSTAAPEEAAEV